MCRRLSKESDEGGKVLDNNGKEFTDRLFDLNKRAAAVEHEFEELFCTELGIEHRLTPSKTPQTNGMVERFNGRIKEVFPNYRFLCGEELETTPRRDVWFFNQQLRQSVIGSKSPMKMIKGQHKLQSAAVQ